jgi:hypothetical protein
LKSAAPLKKVQQAKVKTPAVAQKKNSVYAKGSTTVPAA